MTRQRWHKTISITLTLVLLGMAVCFTTPVSAAGVSITRTFYSTADSYVDQVNSTINYGALTTMEVRTDMVDLMTPKNRRSFVKFDLSSLATGSSFSAATVQLYMSTAPTVTRTYGAYGVSANWSETGITWDSQPATASATSTTATGTTSAVWLSWNILSDVQAWIQNQTATNYGWAIKDGAENGATLRYSIFSTKEASSNKPILSVTFTAPWNSYQDSGRTTASGSFTSGSTAYMKGTGFTSGTYYVAYYDGSGQRVGSASSVSVGADGVLLSQIATTTTGTWNALVQPSPGYTAFSTSYTTVVGAPDTYGLLANSSFTVTATAVRVETAANGSGTVVPTQNITSGNSITVYAITRDASNNFLANVAADAWSLESITGGVVAGDLVASGDNKSAVFTGHGAGSAQIKATSGSLTTTNSGTLTVPAYITVTAPSAISLGIMTVGQTKTGQSLGGTVSTNAASFTVIVQDKAGGTKTQKLGFMTVNANGSGNSLAAKFQIKKAPGDILVNADTGFTVTTGTALDLYVSQNVTSGDAGGSYTITITFTASASS